MQYQPWNEGWVFSFAESESSTVRMIDGATRPVTLPHDFQLEQSRFAAVRGGAGEAFYPGGVGFYAHTLTADDAMAHGRVFLYIDGAYRIAQCRVNRELAAVHKDGYTGFWVDLSGRLSPGDNQILISVDAGLTPGSRWYTGGGLYRGVTLVTGGSTILSPWSLCVRTKAIGANAVVSVSAHAEGPLADVCGICYTIFDMKGTIVVEKPGTPGAETDISVLDARLWSPDDPCLYTLKAALMSDGETLDTETVPFGIRTVMVDAQSGMTLNGKPVKLRGGCVHHDNGVLGAKSHPDADYRKAKLLRDNGFNAVRCAHNPPSSAFLNACDALGLLVIDEAFDCWREGKRQYDGHLFFEECWEDTLRAMVLRDRNHPSVIIWSTGNEIVERSGVSDGTLWSKRIADKLRALDSTRPLLNAVCGFFEDPAIAELAANSLSTAGEGKDFWAERSEAFLAPLDIAGYNYLLNRYEKDHALFPGRVFLGTESFPMQALENWQAVEKHPYLLGDFVWTAWDYLGEAGIGHSSFDGDSATLMPYPWHLAWCGDLDVCGDKRPQSYYRDFVFGIRTKPCIFTRHPRRNGLEERISPWGWPEVAPSWTYPGFEGQAVQVTVYARGMEVELFVNGVSQGRQAAGEAARYTATFSAIYQAGELKAVAYENGTIIGEDRLVTAGAPRRVSAMPETRPETVKPGGLLYIRLALEDTHGTVVPDADGLLTVAVRGAKLIALGCADPAGTQTYLDASVKPYQGRALAVVRAGGGDAALTIRYPGLAPVQFPLPFGRG